MDSEGARAPITKSMVGHKVIRLYLDFAPPPRFDKWSTGSSSTCVVALGEKYHLSMFISMYSFSFTVLLGCSLTVSSWSDLTHPEKCTIMCWFVSSSPNFVDIVDVHVW